MVYCRPMSMVVALIVLSGYLFNVRADGPTANHDHHQVGSSNSKSSGIAPIYGYRIIRSFPHDSNAFTQGFTVCEERLFEGTGLHGSSSLRETILESGTVIREHKLSGDQFGEGICCLGTRIYQLTWRSGIGYVYDSTTFEPIDEFHYDHEGWGITGHDTTLYLSDGTSIIRKIDSETYQPVGTLHVHHANGPLEGLNELEWIDGEIYANVWPTALIARISPQTGEIVGWINMSGILASVPHGRVDVMNGIAYDEHQDRIYITGKFWPRIFEIELIHMPGQGGK